MKSKGLILETQIFRAMAFPKQAVIAGLTRNLEMLDSNYYTNVRYLY
jgi:hypothetical protein